MPDSTRQVSQDKKNPEDTNQEKLANDAKNTASEKASTPQPDKKNTPNNNVNENAEKDEQPLVANGIPSAVQQQQQLRQPQVIIVPQPQVIIVKQQLSALADQPEKKASMAPSERSATMAPSDPKPMASPGNSKASKSKSNNGQVKSKGENSSSLANAFLENLNMTPEQKAAKKAQAAQDKKDNQEFGKTLPKDFQKAHNKASQSSQTAFRTASESERQKLVKSYQLGAKVGQSIRNARGAIKNAFNSSNAKTADPSQENKNSKVEMGSLNSTSQLPSKAVANKVATGMQQLSERQQNQTKVIESSQLQLQQVKSPN